MGWWYAFPLPGTKLDYELLDVFPNVNHIFGTHQDAMAMFWLQAKYFKRHGTSSFRVMNDGYETLKGEVADRSAVEKGYDMFARKGKRHHIKLGHAQLSPTGIWSTHNEAP